MIDPNEVTIIKDFIEEFLAAMTVDTFTVETSVAPQEANSRLLDQHSSDSVDISITLSEPQMLIGQNGQTLDELQRLLRLALNKKLKKLFYVNVDINSYKKKKVDYLKNLAEESASEVVSTKAEKILPPMSPSERRIIHMQLAQREDIMTESQMIDKEKRIIIKPK